jgi:hypothetical protein
MSSLVISAAVAAAEKLAPVIIAGLEPELAKVLTSLSGKINVSTSPASPAVTVEASVAKNLVAAVPAANDAMYAKFKTQIGQAIAVYMTDKPDADLQDTVTWVDIMARAEEGWTREGIVVSAIAFTTRWQMFYSGIEMYRAGLGTRPLTVER